MQGPGLGKIFASASALHKGGTVLRKKKGAKRLTKEAMTAYCMLLPDVLGLLVFVFIPIIYAFYISLHSWTGLSDMQFIGFDNYIKMTKDRMFIKSIWVTAKYALMYVPGVFVMALLMANLLNALHGKVQSFFRTAYFLPYAISTVIAGIVWSFMYNPMNGFLNQIIVLAGGEKMKFLASPSQALPSAVVVGIWLVLGYNTILFLAAIKDIPKSYYEAAELDGAGPVQKFFRITVPLIKDTSVFVLVMCAIASFQAFDQIKVMTGGGPANATTTSVLYIYREAFETFEMGYSSALAFVLFLIIMVLTLAQMKLLKSRDD